MRSNTVFQTKFVQHSVSPCYVDETGQPPRRRFHSSDIVEILSVYSY